MNAIMSHWLLCIVCLSVIATVVPPGIFALKMCDYKVLGGGGQVAWHACRKMASCTFVGKVTKMKKGDNFVGCVGK
jgi:hypothetical protein